MITSVKINALRGVRDGLIEGLSPLSVLVGPNNSGKSTVLEALWMALSISHANRAIHTLLRRGGSIHNALASIVSDDATSSTVDVVLNSADGRSQQLSVALSFPRPRDTHLVEQARQEGLKEPIVQIQLHWKYESTFTRIVTHLDGDSKLGAMHASGTLPKTLPSTFVDVEAVRETGALEDAYSALERANQLTSIIACLGRSMPGLRDLRILKSDEQFLLHTFVEDRKPVPAYLAGDGFKRFLELAAAAAVVGKDGIVLLEEPECFQHPRYIDEIARLLISLAKTGTQFVLSTHSIELLDRLLHSSELDGETFPTVHRVRLRDGVLRATTLLRQDALAARDDLFEDLRL